MENDLMPLISTIAIASLIIVGSNIATFVILLNHLSGRIDRSEQRLTEAMRSDKTELQETIRDTEQRLTEAMRSDKAELQETIRDTEQRLTEAMRSDKTELQETIRDTEQRLTRRMDRFEDKTDANFETLRNASSERATEQPVAGDD